ncbi:M48 family metallopeptidase [uncultured Gilvimarinus sp.]|uniref:M48 family metallopeptidase n=1 Tax=uncultured Gilvimarinus sp. TaxID=1689143 RepID=UPI0030EECBB0|tara:strand:+ start:4639 stop:6561 length:1923 start_codon:yes stop_codon:yes gene_type:complete
MNFFEQQDIARRNTKRLVVLLILAVLSLIAVTSAMFAGVMLYLQTNNSAYHIETAGLGFWSSLGTLLDWQTVSGISMVVITVVLIGGLFKYQQLRRGGRVVAESLGGRLINTDTRDANERKLLNVIEEMAIASGAPVPPVYLMEESAINAFAAGHTPQDAVIGITRGCIERLSRDELQGVIAHEFSHIFHGDMRLNMRLVALLNGILLLGLIGHFMVRGAMYSSIGRSNRDNKGSGIAIAGIGLIIVGYAGTFFGNIIKAAVSRQREFLADASAVQFTRDNSGIAGALKKIGGASAGSKLEAAHSAEFSHMYFSQGVSTAFNSLMATHPPLSERIKRIEPNWDGEFIAASAPEPEINNETNNTTIDRERFFKASVLAAAVEQMGETSSENLSQAQQQLQQIGEPLRDAAHSPIGACAIVFGLLLDTDNSDLRQRQWQSLADHYSKALLHEWRNTVKQAATVDELDRLALLELCLPALKSLSEPQGQTLQKAMDTLIDADNKTDLHEWSLRRIVTHHLNEPDFHSQHKQLRQMRSSCQLVLSYLAHAGNDNTAEATQAFNQALELLRMNELPMLDKSQLNTAALDNALNELNRTRPLQKPQLLKAMMRTIEFDGKITAAEAELFRAIADSLNCPVPPLARQ